jgi:N-methylhydantoinase A/oxoprolinase/acetone carboxylase beta subunit
MCLLGQSYEVNVELEGGIEATSGGDLAAAFHRAYEARYGRAGLEFPIQVLTWRLAASGAVAHGPSLARAQARSLRRHDAAAPGSRPAYFPDLGFVDCPVHSRYALSAGTVLAGPAVIEEDECTTVVAPGETVAVDEFANLVIERTA